MLHDDFDHPFHVEAFAAAGIDLVHAAWEDPVVRWDSFDLVVSLTPEAHHRAVEMARGRAADIEYWPTHDPTLSEGSREHRLEAYRQVRDSLAARIAQRFGRE